MLVQEHLEAEHRILTRSTCGRVAKAAPSPRLLTNKQVSNVLFVVRSFFFRHDQQRCPEQSLTKALVGITTKRGKFQFALVDSRICRLASRACSIPNACTRVQLSQLIDEIDVLEVFGRQIQQPLGKFRAHFFPEARTSAECAWVRPPARNRRRLRLAFSKGSSSIPIWQHGLCIGTLVLAFQRGTK